MMLHAKFQNHGPSGSGQEDFQRFLLFIAFSKVFAIYSPGGDLGQGTWTIYTNFSSPFLRMLHMKFEFDLPSGFREDD